MNELLSPFICIGDGTEGDGCGHEQQNYNEGICGKCGKMVLSEQGIEDSNNLIKFLKKQEKIEGKKSPPIKIDIPVYKFQDFSCVRIRDIKDENLRKKLTEFMGGQTRPLINDIDINEQDFIYTCDYINFLHKEKTGKERFWD